MPDGKAAESPKSTEDKILEELVKTGFPTELVAGSIMESWDYGVIYSPSYRDHQDGKSREFDLRAFKTWPVVDETPKWGMSVFLVTECKKSDGPWVFFATPEAYRSFDWLGDPIPLHHNTNGLHEIGNTLEEKVSLDRRSLMDVHHYRSLPRRARTYYEPFKKGRDHNSVGQSIYTAVMQCTKAVIFLSSEKPRSRYPAFFYPVIVFSGDMFEATIAPDKSISLARKEYIQLSHHYLYEASRHSIFEDQEFIIDVVRDSYLPTYLGIIEKEMTAIASTLRTTVLTKWQPWQPPEDTSE